MKADVLQCLMVALIVKSSGFKARLGLRADVI